MKYNKQHEDNRRWEESDQEKFEEEIRKCESSMNNKDGDKMNVDRMK